MVFLKSRRNLVLNPLSEFFSCKFIYKVTCVNVLIGNNVQSGLLDMEG